VMTSPSSRGARVLRYALVASAFAPGVLTAQQPTDTAALPPVVVTATRVATPRAAVAQAVTVITGTELHAQGIRTVADALRQLPSAALVATGSFGGQTSLFLRGGESDYVKVLLDGVPLNDPGGAFDFADLTTDNLDRIEIVRGPASVLYGSDAVAGVIQLFTRDGAGGGAPEVRARAAGGTYDSGLFDAEISGRAASGALGYSLSASRATSNGIFAFNNRYERTTWAGRVRATPDARTDVSLTARGGDNAYHFPTNGAGQLVDSNQVNADQGPAIALAAGRRLGERVELRLLVGFTERDARYDDAPDYPADTAFVYSSRQRIRRRSAEARANVHVGGGGLVTAGVALEDARLRSSDECSSAFGPCSSPPIDTSRSTLAVFAQALTDVGRRWTLSAGLRLDDNSQFGSFLTWRAGGAWRLGTATRLRAWAGAGFKEPTFVENYATGFATGNPDLDPERSLNWEAGLEQGVAAGRVTLSATYFHQRFQDLVEYDFARTPNYVNVAAARAQGLELGATGILVPGLSVEAHYTYLDTRVTGGGADPSFEEGERLLRRPAHSGGASIELRRPARGAVSLRLRFVGERDDLDFSTFPAPRVPMSPYTRTDLAAEYDVVRPRTGRPGLTLQTRIDNLFDDHAREVANFPVPGRVVIFGGEIRYGN
ncbi:MAG: TonB-dependent receptor plug domain-containing protein, partial [Acidimicrobiales bacterium]